jgi:hypothetical protein
MKAAYARREGRRVYCRRAINGVIVPAKHSPWPLPNSRALARIASQRVKRQVKLLDLGQHKRTAISLMSFNNSCFSLYKQPAKLASGGA